MPDIFISYASEDKAIARSIAEHLQRLGHRVWWDDHIESGLAFDKVIEEAIREAKVAIVLWSSFSIDSDWVRAEASEALDRGKLIPAIIEPDIQLPLRFRNVQSCILYDGEVFTQSSGYERFIVDLKSKISQGAYISTGKPGVEDKGKLVDHGGSLAEDKKLKYYAVKTDTELKPALSPYLNCLVDRVPQIEKLQDVIVRNIEQESTKPIACILPGQESEEHNKLALRFCKFELPNLLSGLEQESQCKDWTMIWPSERSSSKEAFQSLLRRFLIDRLKLPLSATPDQVRTKLDLLGNHFILNYDIYSRRWSPKDVELINLWVDYLQKLPESNRGYQLVVIFCFIYNEGPKKTFFDRIFQSRDNKRSMQRFIVEVTSRANGKLICLDELGPVYQDHVYDWIVKICQHHKGVNEDLLREKIKEYFSREPEPCPLEPLLKHLKEALDICL